MIGDKAPIEKLNPILLDILRCPQTKDRLVYDEKNNELISKKAKLAFPIRDGVPILLINHARSLS